MSFLSSSPSLPPRGFFQTLFPSFRVHFRYPPSRSPRSRARHVIKVVHIYPEYRDISLSPQTFSSRFPRRGGADAQPRRVLSTRPIDRLNDDDSLALKALRSHGGGVKNSILRDLLPRNKPPRRQNGRCSFLREASRERRPRADREFASAMKKIFWVGGKFFF